MIMFVTTLFMFTDQFYSSKERLLLTDASCSESAARNMWGVQMGLPGTTTWCANVRNKCTKRADDFRFMYSQGLLFGLE
jgi:hypothetical protein